MTKPIKFVGTCELCTTAGGELVWENTLCRVVSVADPDYPGFCRVILKRHEREMSELPENEQHELMRIVFAVEASVRRVLGPDKINLASLGNVVPHLHWHVIPRFADDRHFPAPVWATPQREAATAHTLPHLADCLRERLATLHQHP